MQGLLHSGCKDKEDISLLENRVCGKETEFLYLDFSDLSLFLLL